MRQNARLCALLLLGLLGCTGSDLTDERASYPGFTLVSPEGWESTTLTGVRGPVLAGPPLDGIRPNLLIEQTFERETPLVDAIQLFRASNDLGGARRWEAGEAWTSASGLTGHAFRSFRENSVGIALIHHHLAIALEDRVLILTGTCAEASREAVGPLFSQALDSITVRPSG